MKCHENNRGNQGNHKHSPLKHMLHMILCCGLPIVVIWLLPFIARISPSAAGLLGKVAAFICPLMMFSMMLMIMGGSKKVSCCDNEGNDSGNKESI